MENVTLTLAIIGAITGILGLIVQFIEYKKTNVKIKMKIDEKRTFYNKYKSKTGEVFYKCDYIGVISVKISNCSSLPITIDEAKLVCKNKEVIYLNSKKAINCNKNTDDGIVKLNLYEQAKLPLRIDCYDTIFLSFIFPYIDDIFKDEFEFAILTPRKDYKIKCFFREFDSLFYKK